jgi:hypothetical protein
MRWASQPLFDVIHAGLAGYMMPTRYTGQDISQIADQTIPLHIAQSKLRHAGALR